MFIYTVQYTWPSIQNQSKPDPITNNLISKTIHKLKKNKWIYLQRMFLKNNEKIWFDDDLNNLYSKLTEIDVDILNYNFIKRNIGNLNIICSQISLTLTDLLKHQRSQIQLLLLHENLFKWWRQDTLQSQILMRRVCINDYARIDIKEILAPIALLFENISIKDDDLFILGRENINSSTQKYYVVDNTGDIYIKTKNEIDNKLFDNYQKYASCTLLTQIVEFITTYDHNNAINCNNCNNVKLQNRNCIFCRVYIVINQSQSPTSSHKKY